MNALPEEISGITGWGEKKVERWCGTMREPFRVRKAARRGLEGDSRRAESSINLPRNESSMIPTRDESFMTDDAGQTPLGGRHEDANREREKRDNTADRRPDHRTTLTALSAEKGPLKRPAENAPPWEPGPEEEEALLLAAAEAEDLSSTSGNVASGNEGLSEGMMAALAKLRKE